MPNLHTLHPELKELTAFGLGRLSDLDSQGIERHLAECHVCRQNLEDVPDDALIGLLQAPAEDAHGQLTSSSADTSAATHCSQPTWFLKHAPAPPNDQTRDSAARQAAFTVPRDLEGHARYLVLAPLGAGGMGTVYKAQHRLMERVVALKIVNPLLVHASGAVERFTREVKAAAQLVHPNIVTAYDAEKVGDLHLLVMEFVEGQTLAQVLADQHELPVALACEYMRQTALGLQHAVDRGMVHRDIKPQNLMLVRSNRIHPVSTSHTPQPAASGYYEPVIKILDFGLARFVSEHARGEAGTASGTLMGSPDYMAPEQAEDARTADARADIYGMGCTLYHLLSGRLPHPASSLLGKLEAHCYRQAPRLHQVRSSVPVALARIVEKMMAKDPAGRYQTPAEVAEALRPFTEAGRDGAAAPRPPSRIRRRFAIAGVVALGVLLLIAGLGYRASQFVFRIETPQGTLVVKTDDPKVQISVKPGGKEFQIKSASDQKPVTLEFEPAAVAAQAKPGAADRRAAEEALAIGGKVQVNGQPQDIAAADLPAEPFRLTGINHGHNPRVSDAGLVHVKDCQHLTQLVLGSYVGDTNVNVSDTGLARFQHCRDLTYLSLGGTQVSDTGLGFLKDCKKLRYLHLDGTKVGDDGLAHFQELNLAALSLTGTRVTDVGLARFKNCQSLYWLWLGDTQAGDAGLAHFKDCQELRYLILSKTQVTDAGLTHLANCKHLVQLFLDGLKVGDAGLAHFREFENISGLNLAGTEVSDAGLAHFKNCKGLRLLHLENTQVGDPVVAHIKDFQALETLILHKTKVTAAGVAELKKALPRCEIKWDRGEP